MTRDPQPHPSTSGPRRRLVTGLTRARLLALLRGEDRAWSVRELATELDLHPNSVREHLDGLIGSGLVRSGRGTPMGRGRPELRYHALPELDPSVPYRELARVLADELGNAPDGAERAVAAGERWGREVVGGERAAPSPGTEPEAEPAERLVALLDATGFAPEPHAEGTEIRLRRCPFGPLARERQSVVCGVHLGLMRGALAELGAPFDAVRLEPFVEPDLCVARLGPSAPASGTSV